MRVKDVLNVLEKLAPRTYQENYDNSGLQVGDDGATIKKVLVCLDCTEAVVDEAIAIGAGLIVAHHPLLFSGIKSLTGKNYIEKVVLKAVKNDLAIYAIHTNLDNINLGVNQKIGEMLGLDNLEILEPKAETLFKLVTYVPHEFTKPVLQAMFDEGAGHIGNYEECSFQHSGVGSYKANSKAKPFVGKKDVRHLEAEDRIEVLVPKHLQGKVVQALIKAHPYEEVAYDIHRLENLNKHLGAGMVGELKDEMFESDFLQFVKKSLKSDCIRHTELLGKPVKKIAFCGGSGSFLLSKAIGVQADVFITGDFKYHQFFEANGKILIADVGHFESEQFTIELLADYLMEKFPTFAVLKTSVNTNPIAYV